MSESERTLVPRGANQGRRPSIAEMQARIGALEAGLAAAHEREAAMAEGLRERTRELAARNSEFGERIEHQSTIDVLKAMSASPGDPQPVFDLIVRRARDLCNAPVAGLFEFEGELVHRRSWVGTEAYSTPEAIQAYQRLFPMVPTRGSLSCRAILDRQTIHVRDLATEPGVSAALRNLLGGRLRVRSGAGRVAYPKIAAAVVLSFGPSPRTEPGEGKIA